MTKKTLYEVFELHFKHVKWDTKLATKVYNYQVGYVNTNREYLEFFGSNLLGVHVIRFKDSDVLKLFDHVLDVDMLALSDDIKHVSAINQDFKISSDTYNITCMYMIHKFLTAPTMNDKQRYRGAYDTALIFFYRCIAALLSYYFKYPTDPKIAQAAYARLSGKYLIKQVGSWHKVMDYRATALLSQDSPHIKQLMKFNDDYATVYAMNDSQGRIKDLVKNYANEFYSTHEEGGSIGITSGTYVDLEGEEKVADKTNDVQVYLTYTLTILPDLHAWVKDELVKVIIDINGNTSFKLVKSVLEWLSDNSTNAKYSKDIQELISTTVIHSFHLLKDNETVHSFRDYPNLLIKLKFLYLANRSSDNDLMRMRELMDRFIKLASHKSLSEALAITTRTAVLLYIMLRTLIGKSK